MNVRNRTAERRRAAKHFCVTRLLVESFVVIFNNNDPLCGYLRTSFSSRVSHRIVEQNRHIFVLRRNALCRHRMTNAELDWDGNTAIVAFVPKIVVSSLAIAATFLSSEIPI